jgi:hypothetical protein
VGDGEAAAATDATASVSSRGPRIGRLVARLGVRDRAELVEDADDLVDDVPLALLMRRDDRGEAQVDAWIGIAAQRSFVGHPLSVATAGRLQPRYDRVFAKSAQTRHGPHHRRHTYGLGALVNSL